MNSDRQWIGMKNRFLLRLCLYLACLLIPSTVLAESQSVVWNISYEDGLSQAKRDEAKAVLLRILGRAEEKHYATDESLKRKLSTEGFQLPGCFYDGTACSSGASMALDIFNVDAIAKAKFGQKGKNWTMSLTLRQRYSAEPRQIEREAAQLDELVRQTLGELFTLESTFDVNSTPQGAQLYINDKLVGETPMTIRVQEGTQHVVVKKDGYSTFETTVKAQKGMSHPVDAVLEMLPTQLTVLATDPAAEIWIDGELAGHSNETLNVLPGTHEVEARSERYENMTQTIKLYSQQPRNIQFALLPKPVSNLKVRDRGIRKYKHGLYLGYHFDANKVNLIGSSFEINAHPNTPGSRSDYFFPRVNVYNELGFDAALKNWKHTSNDDDARHDLESHSWDNYYFHGIELGFTNETGLFSYDPIRIVIAGASGSSEEIRAYSAYEKEPLILKRESAFELGIYPVVGRVHFLFPNIPLQLEASFAAGYEFIRTTVSVLQDKDPEAGRPNDLEAEIDRHALAFTLRAGMRYYFSEEYYMGLGYTFGANIYFGLPEVSGRTKVDASFSASHNVFLNFGVNIPFDMNDTSDLYGDGDSSSDVTTVD